MRALLLILPIICGCCSFSIEPLGDVQVVNNLYNIDVTVDNIDYHINRIDLRNVRIGDVKYEHIDANTETTTIPIIDTGTVNISVESATIIISSPKERTYTISNIKGMTMYIIPQSLNTFIFDRTTADIIIQKI
jgi:hypothetical protein